MKAVALVLCLIAAAVADYTILATVRDFNPGQLPDFQTYNVPETGAVQSQLDQDGRPVLKSGSHVAFSQPIWFADWYRDVTNINIPFTFNLNMAESSGTYTYSNNAFFPIDNMGWGNYGSTGHNYHFTTAFDLFFTYNGGETLSVSSANDMWVFVNNVLVVDLGGVNNPAASGNINFDSLGLTPGSMVELSIFAAQRHTPASVLTISTNTILSSFPSDEPVAIPGVDVYICEVLLQNYCPGAPVTPQPSSNSTSSSSGSNTGGDDYEGIPSKRDSTTCTSEYPTLTFAEGGASYGFDGFNVISFGDFNCPSGDIEGRLAVRNNMNAGTFSVGYQLRTGGISAWDQSFPYAAVIGHDATWTDGDVYPDGSNSPYNGEEENIFVGGTFTASSGLTSRRTGGPCNSCLDSQFDAAQAFFVNVQNDFAAIAQNVQTSVQYGTLTITCPDSSAEALYLSVDGGVFSTVSAYNLVGCNRHAQIVITITGTGDVSFQGAQIDHDAEKVLYNILGSRTITVGTSISGSILAPNAIYNQPNSGVAIGIVIVGTVEQALQINRLHCMNPAPVPNPPSDQTNLCPEWEINCEGLNLPLGSAIYSFRDFNVISFDSFTAATGDIEGRLAAKNDVTLGAGYSIGYQLQTSGGFVDNNLPYSLVVGRDLTWISGALYPDGSGIPYAGEEEGIFVGDNMAASSQQDLQNRVTGHCPAGQSGCLDQYFNSAQSCYEGYQSDLASQQDNVAQQIQWSALILTCNDITADIYYVTINPSTMSQYTYTVVNNCNFQATWVLNIIGNGNFNITGGSFPAICGGVVYNVLGSGRTVTVDSTEVCGHILAPQNTLYQMNGVIIGKVVAGDISFSLQINKQNDCPNPGNVTLPTPVAADAPQGVDYLQVASAGNLRPGDSIAFSGQTQTNSIVGINGNTIYLANGLTAAVPAGSVASAIVDGTMGRPANQGIIPSSTGGNPSNSGTVVSVAFSLLIVLFALAF